MIINLLAEILPALAAGGVGWAIGTLHQKNRCRREYHNNITTYEPPF